MATPHPMTRTLGRSPGMMGQQWVMVEGPWQSLCLACLPSPEAPAGPCEVTASGAVVVGGVVVAAAAAVGTLWPALPRVPLPGGPSLGVEARRGRQILRRTEPVLGPPAVVVAVVVEEVALVVLVLVPVCRVPGGLVDLGLQAVQGPAVRGGSSGGLS